MTRSAASEFIYTVGPAVGKTLLSYFVSPLAVPVGETVMRVAAQKFADARDARLAAEYADRLGRDVSQRLEALLIADGASAEELSTTARELSFVLSSVDLNRKVLDAKLNLEALRTDLKSLPLPAGLNTREQDLIRLSLYHSATFIRQLIPLMAPFQIARDEEILRGLKIIEDNIGSIIIRHEDLSTVISSIEKVITGFSDSAAHARDNYERAYNNRLNFLLDYVEIIGLEDIGRDYREASLEVAYLSLSVSSKSDLPSDFSKLLATASIGNRRVVIQGGAGSGKSTLLRWAAVNALRLSELAANDGVGYFGFRDLSKALVVDDAKYEWAQDRSKLVTGVGTLKKWRDINPSPSPASIKIVDSAHTRSLLSKLRGLSIFRSRIDPFASQKALDRVPFLIRLRELDAGLPRLDELPTALSPTIPEPPDGWVLECLSSGRALLLFDGVDEVPEGDRRREILRQITEYADAYPTAAIIVTTRPHAFGPNELGSGDFSFVSVDDLAPYQQEQFIRNWHLARAAKGAYADEPRYLALSESLIKRFTNSPVLARLATNPLLCAAICALHEHDAETLPEDERSLCAELTKMLAHKRDRAPGRSRAIDMDRFGHAYRMSYEKKKALLARLAAEMVRSGASHLNSVDVSRFLASSLREIAQSDLDIHEVCKALVARSGVLRGASYQKDISSAARVDPANTLPEAVEFIHNRFKEWLASTYFLSHGTVGELVARADQEGFAQTCVFAAAAPDNQNFVSSLIDGLLERIAGISSPDSIRRLQVLTVQCALVAQTLPDETRARADALGTRLLPPKSMEEAKALADLGDLALSKLGFRKSRSAREASYCVRCLSIINTPKARSALALYRSDERWTVIEELSRHINPLTIPAVVRVVTDELQERTAVDKLRRIRRRVVEMPLSFPPQDCKFLDLSETCISDITTLSKITSLVALNLSGTNVEDLSPLSKLHALEFLSLNDTFFVDISPIRDLVNIEYLTFCGSNVTDASSLSALTKIKYLDFSDTFVSDPRFLSSFSNLSYLTIDNTPIQDLSLLKDFLDVEYLSASGTRLGDLSFLANWKKLSHLAVGFTEISSLEPLKSCSEIVNLQLRGTKVSDISPIRQLQKIQALDIGETMVDNLDPIRYLPSLISLSLHSCPVEDIGPLADSASIESLYLGFSKVKDIGPVRGIKTLRHIVLTGTGVTDLSPLTDHKSLRIYPDDHSWTTSSALRESLHSVPTA